MSRLAPLVVVLVLASSSLALADFLTEVKKVALQDTDPVFRREHVGYNNLPDNFYDNGENVAKEHPRSKYQETHLTISDERPDLRPANFFVVGERSFKPFGTFKDRWDVKDVDGKYQFLAMFHGKVSESVVNTLRGNFLSVLADSIKDFMPMLDLTATKSAEDYKDAVDEILEVTRNSIFRIFREVDDEVRKQLKKTDDSKASATVLIISQNYVITMSVGKGQVIAIDKSFNSWNLIKPTAESNDSNLFGACVSRPGKGIVPEIEFHRRDKIKYLLIETPAVAEVVEDAKAVESVRTLVDSQLEDEEHDLYSFAILKILDDIKLSKGIVHRFFKHSDYSTMLVALNEDKN